MPFGGEFFGNFMLLVFANIHQVPNGSAAGTSDINNF
jgi:hypothetical protein